MQFNSRKILFGLVATAVLATQLAAQIPSGQLPPIVSSSAQTSGNQAAPGTPKKFDRATQEAALNAPLPLDLSAKPKAKDRQRQPLAVGSSPVQPMPIVTRSESNSSSVSKATIPIPIITPDQVRRANQPLPNQGEPIIRAAPMGMPLAEGNAVRQVAGQQQIPRSTSDNTSVNPEIPIIDSSAVILPQPPMTQSTTVINSYVQENSTPKSVVEPTPMPQTEVPAPAADGGQSFFDDPVELGKELPNHSNAMTFLGEMPGSSDCTCGSCQATTGCNSPRCQYDVGSVNNAFHCCGYVAGAKSYFIGEGLYWFNESGSVIGSTFFSTGDQDGAAGGRFTIGQKEGVKGREFVYTGFAAFVADETRTSGFIGMSANFSTALFPLGLSGPFVNATAQNQRLKSRFHSFELNRTWWGWDVIKSHLGLRYMYYSDDYQLLSSNGFGNGSFNLLAENHFIGPELGIDFFYDVGRRTAFTFSTAIGGGVNLHRGGFEATTNAIQFVDVNSNSADFQWNFQLAVNAHWKLGPRARITAGYDILGLFDVATASENFPAVLTPLAGASLSNTDEVFLHGLSIGFEIYR